LSLKYSKIQFKKFYLLYNIECNPHFKINNSVFNDVKYFIQKKFNFQFCPISILSNINFVQYQFIYEALENGECVHEKIYNNLSQYNYLYSIYEDLIIFRIICPKEESSELPKNKNEVLNTIENEYKIKIIQLKSENNIVIFHVIYNTIIPSTQDDFISALTKLTTFLNLGKPTCFEYDIRILIPNIIADIITSSPINNIIKIKKYINNSVLPSSNEKLIKMRGNLNQLKGAYIKIIEIIMNTKKKTTI